MVYHKNIYANIWILFSTTKIPKSSKIENNRSDGISFSEEQEIVVFAETRIEE